jgi:hypothetical protein
MRDDAARELGASRCEEEDAPEEDPLLAGDTPSENGELRMVICMRRSTMGSSGSTPMERSSKRPEATPWRTSELYEWSVVFVDRAWPPIFRPIDFPREQNYKSRFSARSRDVMNVNHFSRKNSKEV